MPCVLLLKSTICKIKLNENEFREITCILVQLKDNFDSLSWSMLHEQLPRIEGNTYN